jgi:hypothetical protein
MMEVLQWIHKMLGGSSPQTGYTGSLTIILSVMDLMKGAVEAEGMPTNKMGWLILALGIGLRLAKDANKTNSQHPAAEAVTVPAVSASPVTVLPPSGTLSVLILVGLGLVLTGCASYIDYGDGRYGVTKVSEQRSPFGTNGGFAVLQNCEGRYGNLGLEFTDCHDLTNYHPIYSQGQGGQVVSGALTGLGFGLGSAFSGAGSVSSSAVSSSAVSVPVKGH